MVKIIWCQIVYMTLRLRTVSVSILDSMRYHSVCCMYQCNCRITNFRPTENKEMFPPTSHATVLTLSNFDDTSLTSL